jgi:hypothetical protein
MWIAAIALALGLAAAPGRTRGQDKQHVVSLEELNKDAARPAQSRQANEAVVRELLSSEAGQEALKSAKVDYQRVDKAIGQLSDEDLAKVAERSRKAGTVCLARSKKPPPATKAGSLRKLTARPKPCPDVAAAAEEDNAPFGCWFIAEFVCGGGGSGANGGKCWDLARRSFHQAN